MAILYGQRRIGDDFFRHGFRGGNQFGGLDDAIDEADAQRFVGGNHFAGKNHFVRHTLAAQAREPLRAAVAGHDAELHFRLAESRGLAGDAHGAGQRELAAAAEREAVDRRDRRLAHGFELMQHGLPGKRMIFTVDGCARRRAR